MTARSHLSARLEALAVLGGKCATCGNKDFRCLQIDHVNGRGTHQRKRTGTSVHFFKLVVESFRANKGEFQLLCANCNWIKRWEKLEQNKPGPKELRDRQIAKETRNLARENNELNMIRAEYRLIKNQRKGIPRGIKVKKSNKWLEKYIAKGRIKNNTQSVG